jgi:hypothetical protein
MEDFIDEMFSAVDSYYPGSKRKRRETETKTQVDIVEKTWDARPYVKTLPSGEDVEFFTLGALADALGRPIVTLRDWMKKGHIPNAPYRLPAKEDKHGDVRKGRRLYSRDMIEATVEIFDKAGLLHLTKIEWSNHRQVSQDIAEAWDKLRVTN